METPQGVARVFPRRTKATPVDRLAFVGGPPDEIPEGLTSVRVSVTFTWDLEEAFALAAAWRRAAGVPVLVGGPAAGTPGDAFEPGMFLRPGYTITSRGCPKSCWFCFVHQREGRTRLLPIRPGFDVLDDNLLACPRHHVEAVFDMLHQQRQRARFTGGIDPSLIRDWSATALVGLHPDAVFLAYDEPEEWPLVRRGIDLLLGAGMPTRGKRLRCYVLCAYPGDSIGAAENRCRQVFDLGVVPFPMIWRPESGDRSSSDWRKFARRWCRPAAVRFPPEAEAPQKMEKS